MNMGDEIKMPNERTVLINLADRIRELLRTADYGSTVDKVINREVNFRADSVPYLARIRIGPYGTDTVAGPCDVEMLDALNDDLFPLVRLMGKVELVNANLEVLDAVRLSLREVHRRYMKLAYDMRRRRDGEQATEGEQRGDKGEAKGA